MAELASVALILVDKVPVLLTILKKELNQDRNAALLDDVHNLTGHLTEFQAFLQDVEIHENGSNMVKDLIGKIRDVTHEMEDVLDLFNLHAPRDFSTTSFIQKSYIFFHDVKHCIPVHGIQSKITSIDASVSKIKSSTEYEQLVKLAVNPTQPHTNILTVEREEYNFKKALQKITDVIKRLHGSNIHPPREERDNEIMGTKMYEESLINLLTKSSRDTVNSVVGHSGTGKTTVISVVGHSGTGKTVLVSCVYKSKIVIDQFDCHAWLSLSHTDNHEQRLKNLLSQFFGLRINELHSPLEADIVTKLKNYLGDKRCLVVLDGIRKEEEWASIKQLLPDHFNGSRMIITTHDEGVATKCASSNENIFRIKELETKDSWKLFCKKAYGNEKCPRELEQLSQMIVERCKGLPQPILAVGTLLSRKPRRYSEWDRVHANCVNAMFLPSYYDLHINQKSCLLYFSLFPEDYSIKRERLIRLWLSEGFVNESETVCPEKIATDILNELISRNLVNASSRDFRGRVKSCRVLNLMREFICQKSKEMKFAAIATDGMYRMEGHKYRRLSVVNASSGLKRTKGLHLDSVRSLFMFGPGKMSSKMIAETLKSISFLKVLDLENAHLNSFPDCILDAALLRYLSLRNTNVNEIPKTIETLRYLEYLDLKQTQVTWLPEQVFSLDKLKHLLVSYRCSLMSQEAFDSLQGTQIIGAMRGWSSIQKLSIIKIDNNPGFFEMLRQLTRLTKLGLNNLRAKDVPLLCSCIVNMQDLSTLDLTSSMEEIYLDHMSTFPSSLRHLYLKGRLTILPKWIPSLHGLVKLLLRGSKLSDSPVDNLRHLRNLVELEMTNAFTGKMLLFHMGFPKLRTLYIEQFDGLERIEVRDGGMPILQKLIINRCLHLCDLPYGIEGLKSLEEFLLYNMPQHLTRKLDKTSKEHRRIKHVPIIKSYGNAESSRYELHNFS